MAKTGGFSKADVAIMFESNAQAVAKGFDQLNTQFSEMNQLLRASVTATKKQTDAMSKLYKQQTKVEKSTKGMVTHLRDWMIVIGQARAAFLNLKMVTTDIYGSILGVSSQFERLRKLMEGLSSQTEPIARLQEVNEKMEYLLNLSKNAPFAISELQNAFIKFETVGLQPANGSLNALVDAVAAFGGSGQELERAGVAIQQMMGKGVISMEELRQQLGEAVPTAMKAMADAAGMSVAELTKLVSKGVVESKSAIDAMLAEFARLYGGAAEGMMETASGLISKLRTEFTLFVNEAAEKSGLIDNIKERIKSLVDVLSSPEALETGKYIAATLNVILNTLTPIVEILVKLGKVLAYIAEWVIVKNIFLKLAGALNLVNTTAKGLVASAALTAFAKKLKIIYEGEAQIALLTGKKFPMAAGLFEAAVFSMKRAWTALSLVFKASPIGLIIGGLTAVYLAFQEGTIRAEKQRAAVEELNKELEKMVQLEEAGKPGVSKYDKGTFEAAKQQIKEVNKQLEELEKLQFNKSRGSYYDKERLAELEKQRAELEKQRELLQHLIDLNRELKNIEATKEYGNYLNLVEKAQQADEELRAFYKKGVQEIDDSDADSIEKAKMRNALMDKYKEKVEEARKSILNFIDDIKNDTSLSDKFKNQILPAMLEFYEEWAKAHKKMIEQTDIKVLAGKTEFEATKELYRKQYSKLLLARMEDQALAGTETYKDDAVKRANEYLDEQIEILKKRGLSEIGITKKLREETKGYAQEYAKLNKEKSKSAFNSKLQAKAEDKIIETATNYATQLELSQKLQAEGVDLTSAEVALYGQLYAKTAKLTEAKREELKATIEKTVAVKEHTEGLIALDKMTNEIEQGWANLQASKTDNLDDYLKLVVSNAKKELHYDRLTAEEKLRADKLILEQRALEEANWWDKHKTALQGTMEEWSNFGRQIDDVWNTTFENLSDALYDFTQTGEFNFKNFANTIIQELTKIGIKAMLAESAMALLGTGGDSKNTLWGGLFSLAQTGLAAAGSFGSSGNLSTGVGDTVDVGNLQSSLGKGDIITTNDLDKIGGWIAVKAHTGGIIGASNLSQHLVSPEMFANATKYHDGGITGLKSDEVPAILQKGEGVFTKEQMKAMGNSKANVTVNVINNTQEQVTAQQSQPRFDGEKMILDVVLKNMNQPGSFRDGMTGAMR